MNFSFYLAEQFKLHPSMQLQDIAKMCYQASFGAEHMLSDIQRARDFFFQEYEQVSANPLIPLYEHISDTFCRVNLAAWKSQARNPEDLFLLFVSSVSDCSINTEADIHHYANEVKEFLSLTNSPYTIAEWEIFYSSYSAEGTPSVHHSQTYRLAEHPAYRLVRTSLLERKLRCL